MDTGKSSTLSRGVGQLLVVEDAGAEHDDPEQHHDEQRHDERHFDKRLPSQGAHQ
jgi:hypothetical protein